MTNKQHMIRHGRRRGHRTGRGEGGGGGAEEGKCCTSAEKFKGRGVNA